MNNLILLSVDFITGFGSWVCFISVNWFLLELTGLSSTVALQSIIYTFAGLVFSPFMGILIDKFRVKHLISVISIIRGVASLLVCFAVVSGVVSVYEFYILNFINGLGFSLYSNSVSTLIRKLDKKELISKSNSYIEFSLHSSSFIAGLLAALLFNRFLIQGVLLINSICFIASSFIIIFYSEPPIVRNHDNERKSYFREMEIGLKYLVSKKQLFILGFLAYFPTLIAACFNLLLPVMVIEKYPLQPELYSFSYSGYSIGVAIGSLLLGIGILRRFKDSSITNGAFIMILVTMIILRINILPAMLIISMCYFGLACSVIRVKMNTQYINAMDLTYSGRVLSVISTFTRIIQMILVSWISFLNDKLSISASVVFVILFSIVSYSGFAFGLRNISRE
ncbi:MFS transporter [Parasphaerochaeta coccoides]|uniref:Major facilitator superfamily MFS_1 n=1 Tax=Parasphaerochaeta coccoides (strain ATCC BAA-1237 / DSM 17374 / SPN1) TaxID=760011 RepID=F4GL34_PARC1|nr:MFS transporter [Parasphaerochaeta coccoides]AEC02374.1 major facilitator superfamily MFS_1 [Parasphaerochaeta coccoides DSM 17374]